MSESRIMGQRDADELARIRYVRRGVGVVLVVIEIFTMIVGVGFFLAVPSEATAWLPSYGGVVTIIAGLAVLIGGMILFGAARAVR